MRSRSLPSLSRPLPRAARVPLLVLVATAAVACGGGDATPAARDEALDRDLTLAASGATTPTTRDTLALGDTAMAVPAPVAEAPAPTPVTAPVRPAPTRVASAPPPRPVERTPTPAPHDGVGEVSDIHRRLHVPNKAMLRDCQEGRSALSVQILEQLVHM